MDRLPMLLLWRPRSTYADFATEPVRPYLMLSDRVGWCDYTPSSVVGRCITTSFVIGVAFAVCALMVAGFVVARLGARKIVSKMRRTLQQLRSSVGRYVRSVFHQRKRRHRLLYFELTHLLSFTDVASEVSNHLFHSSLCYETQRTRRDILAALRGYTILVMGRSGDWPLR